MPVTLTSSDPAAGSTDVYLNKRLVLTFSEEVDFTTVNNQVISLVDKGSGLSVTLTFSSDPVNVNKVIVIPSATLKEDTTYRLTILGADIGLAPYFKSKLSNLQTTTSISFRTGDNLYDIDTEINKEANSKTLEGDLFLPSNVEALGLELNLVSISPQNRSNGVAPSLAGNNNISFEFNKTLATGQSSLPNWASVEVSPIMDFPGYLASGTTVGEFPIPEYSIEVTGNYLNINFSTEIPKNARVVVSLNSNIVSEDSYYYSTDSLYIINTELYPKISGINSLRTELNSISVDLYDDYLGALLLKNALYLWESSGRSISLDSPSFAAYKYVLNSTIIDVIADKDLEKFILAGTRKRIADIDFSVSPLVGRLAIKLAKAEKEKEEAEETIFKGWQIRTGVLSVYAEAAEQLNRLWHSPTNYYRNPVYKYYQKDLPLSNIKVNREAKTNNPGWI